MSVLTLLSGERYNSKVAAIFSNEAVARKVAQRLRESLGLERSQVRVITPGDRHPGAKMQPEDRGISRTIAMAHIWLALAGAAVGLLVFGVLYAVGIPAVTSSAIASGTVLVAFGAVAGLLLGGLFSLRPDQDAYIMKVYQALQAGSSAVVVQTRSADERDRVDEALQARGAQPSKTLL